MKHLLALFLLLAHPAEAGSLSSAPPHKHHPATWRDLYTQSDYCGLRRLLETDGSPHWADTYVTALFAQKGNQPLPLSPDTEGLLRALFSGEARAAAQKFGEVSGWRAQLFRGLTLAGLVEGEFLRLAEPTAADLKEGANALAEAARLNPENGMIPAFQAVVMDRQKKSHAEIAQFLREKWKSKSVESALARPYLDVAALAVADPRLYALHEYYFLQSPASNFAALQSFLGELAGSDPAMAEAILHFAELWRNERLAYIESDLPEELSLTTEYLLATNLAALAWKKAHPKRPLPERFSAKFSREKVRALAKKNPRALAGFAGKKCGPGWRAIAERERDHLGKQLARYKKEFAAAEGAP